MRGYLTSPLGVAVSAALVLPALLTSGAAAAPRVPEPDIPGSTRSLPLAPADPMTRSAAPDTERRLSHPRVSPFSLVGVVWDDARAELHGTAQVRTRSIATGAWSRWRSIETHNHEHGADPGTAENRAARGSTAPLWVGPSNGVEVRVRAGTDTGPVPLPQGLRLELVDPGEAPAVTAAAPGIGTVTGPLPPGVPGFSVTGPMGTVAGPKAPAAKPAPIAPEAVPAQAAAKPYIGPRPKIVTRKGWGASESLREKGFVYSTTVKAAFVHHSATGNSYTCKQAPSVLRSIYRYHVVSSGWRDIGYNFAVDKCGNVYEGRAGGVTKAVRGAHTLGFNTNTMGIAVLGTYSTTKPPAAAVTAVAKLTAWKLGLFKRNPKGKVTLTSGGSGKYAKGRKVSFQVISGHRDGFLTDCPGTRLYNTLGSTRTASAKLQGRS
ncbi:peptidoglycan recognition protein [Streptomyces sp. CAU 1734]|uniref:peptidoglycan recognition protein family protein n=1 Tax=Streptomyces sp. CAU 1734 TaxID=3140360 RepID=UPI003260A3AB